MIFQQNFEHSQKLFEAALQEFIAHGYEQASINTILENAGMSKGQFYYHFKNKEGLYLALIDSLIEKKKAFLTSAMKPEDAGTDIFSLFKTQMKHSMAFAGQYPVISQFAESFLREKGSEIYRKALAAYDFENNDAITMMIKRALDKGDFRDDLPAEFIQKLIAYLFTHIADLADLSTSDQFERGVDFVVDFIQYGLAKKDDATSPGQGDAA